jgi:phosphatidylglycerol:prolipoprotein diacylglycerol transferase
MGPLPIRAFGVTLALTFVAGVYYVSRMTARDNKPFEPYLMLAYIFILGGIFGARLSYVLLHLSEFSDNWTSSFNPFGSATFGLAGLNLYGGVVVSILAALIYCRIKRMNILNSFDYFAPPLALGIGITRIGCFLNGCCFGTPTDAPWGVVFPFGSIPYSVFGAQHLHPSQLYSSLYGLGLFVLLHFILKRKRFPGLPLAILFMIEAAFRFGLEYVRYYEDAMYFSLGSLYPTYNQVVSIILFASGAAILLLQLQRNRTSD